jgi:alkane 1-monooxygenase
MFKELKYLTAYSIPLLSFLALNRPELFAFAPVIFGFVIVPFLDFIIPIKLETVSETEQQARLKRKIYDYFLYLSVPIQWALIGYFIYLTSQTNYSGLQLTGMILSVGLCSGVIGINVAHELGHRKNRFEQFLSQLLLLSSLYMHFFVEHNSGHHKYVGTPYDPPTARFGESLYRYLPRTLLGSYVSAWRIQLKNLEKNKQGFFSINNQMLYFQTVQVLLILCLLMLAGLKITVYFLITAFIGMILLEVINYIEHYGLVRKETSPGNYERVLPKHSWNAEQILGRIILFELTRHSDHHYLASRKYQVLRFMQESPQLPAGYPAMMLLSTIPPLWFHVMNRRVMDAASL